MSSQWFVRVFLVVWATSLTVVGACLMVSHWVPLPNPPAAALAQQDMLVRPADGRWTVFHFLYTECPCSRRVLEHVIERAPLPSVNEQVVLIGGDTELANRARKYGFSTDQLAPEQLKTKYRIESAPLMVVVDPQGQVRYSGGYTNRKQGFDIQDTAIVGELRAGRVVEPLPVYGCAVSRGLQAIVDPLGMKSSSRN